MEELLQKLKERLLGAKLDDCISSGAYRDISQLITEIEQLHKHNVSGLESDVREGKQLCLACHQEPATHGIGARKTVCRNCWNIAAG